MLADWREVGDGVWRRRFKSWDLNIGVVRGSDALLIVDTRESHRRALELRDEIRSLSALPVRWVVNTHWHFDHTFGNFVFASPPDQAELWGHETVPGLLAAHGDSVRRRVADDGPELAVDMAELVVTPPDHLVGRRASLDLGAGVVFAGDLVEESAPPYFGPDSFPLDWPATVAALLEMVGSGSVVPGHGDVVDRAFCADQHPALVAVDALIRDLHAAAVPVDDALREGEDRWPWPAAALDDAVRRGYLTLDGGDLDPKLA